MADSTGNDNAENFAALLAEHETGANNRLEPGQKARGRIIAIGNDDVFLDIGIKEDGIMDRKEFVNVDGEFAASVGDEVEAFVTGISSQGVRLSRSMSGAGLAALEEARDAAIPVEGKVKGACKGGYQVDVLGKTAFCPGSQMEAGGEEDLTGRQMRFLITRIENHGRNIVVSRRALLDRERRENLEKLLETLKIGDTVEARITRLAPFGAFAELAPAIEGMIHLSELSWSRVGAADEAVSIGDLVRVKVLDISQDDKGRQRISLSRKKAEGDPWESVPQKFHAGDIVEGKVARLAPFGAFVEIAPGVEGLIHISEMAWGKRINKPEEAVEQGELVKALIKEVDAEARRISLSLKDALGDPWDNVDDVVLPGATVNGVVESKSPYGIFVALAPGITGLLPRGVIKNAKNSADLEKLNQGDSIKVTVATIDKAQKRISLIPENSDQNSGENDASWRQHARAGAGSRSDDSGIMASALKKAFQKKGA